MSCKLYDARSTNNADLCVISRPVSFATDAKRHLRWGKSMIMQEMMDKSQKGISSCPILSSPSTDLGVK